MNRNARVYQKKLEARRDVSVRAEVYAALVVEAARRGVHVAALTDQIIRDAIDDEARHDADRA